MFKVNNKNTRTTSLTSLQNHKMQHPEYRIPMEELFRTKMNVLKKTLLSLQIFGDIKTLSLKKHPWIRNTHQKLFVHFSSYSKQIDFNKIQKKRKIRENKKQTNK